MERVEAFSVFRSTSINIDKKITPKLYEFKRYYVTGEKSFEKYSKSKWADNNLNFERCTTTNKMVLD